MSRGPAPAAFAPITAIAANIYSAVVARRQAAFDEGRGVVTLDRPVISVGNLTVGGTGKTPIVTAIIEALRGRDHDPAIAMRGYRSVAGRSDEADAYARRFEDLPIVAQPDRVEGLIELFGTDRGARVDAVVLDDGFQHRKIARQLDVVAIDAAAEPDVFGDRPLPAGWLREPAAGLARADAVILTHADRVDEEKLVAIEQRCLAINRGLLVARAAHRWMGFDVHGPDGQASQVESLAGSAVVAVCAIGTPERFLMQAADAGVRLCDTVVLRDHDRYSARTVARIESVLARHPGVMVLTTDKDWSKLKRTTLTTSVPIVRPRLAINWLRDGEALLERTASIVAAGSA